MNEEDESKLKKNNNHARKDIELKEKDEFADEVLIQNKQLMRKLVEMKEKEKIQKKKEQLYVEDIKGLLDTLRVDYCHEIKWRKEEVDDYL